MKMDSRESRDQPPEQSGMGGPLRPVRSHGSSEARPDSNEAARRALLHTAHALEKRRPWWWLPRWRRPR